LLEPGLTSIYIRNKRKKLTTELNARNLRHSNVVGDSIRVPVWVNHHIRGDDPRTTAEDCQGTKDDGELCGLALTVPPAVGCGQDPCVGDQGSTAD
jgi:hypothetical protein